MPVTDEDAAIEAITTLGNLSEVQQHAKERINAILATDDPFVDIHELFVCYNDLYFRSLLVPRVEVSWSYRLTLCAGICELVRDRANGNKYSKVRLKLSEPLLKYRPRSDVLNTLLHECIHAYLFITTAWRHSRGNDGTGHGNGFLLLADAISNHGNYEITVYHTFHDEVDSYRTHIWQCDGPCKDKPPFFGLVKRSMNRPPGKGDTWWQQHRDDCGGTYKKIAEPEMTKQQVEKLSSLKRAGQQRNKIDSWVKGAASVPSGEASSQEPEVPAASSIKRGHSPVVVTEEGWRGSTKRPRTTVNCPICERAMSDEEINGHFEDLHAND